MGEAKLNAVALQASTRPKCGTCVHYMPQTEDQGHCRLEPPKPMTIPMQRQAPPNLLKPGVAPQITMEMQLVSNYPPIAIDRWCGQHPDFPVWYAEFAKRN